MADFPSMPLWTDAYIADTMHLTLEEHGAYLKLLMIAWRTPNCSLPKDDKRIARMLGVTNSKWAKLRPAIMEFWDETDTGYEQKKLNSVRDEVSKRTSKQSVRAHAKWGSDPRDDRVKRSQRLAEARKKGRHTKEQWEEMKQMCGPACLRCGETEVELVKDHIEPMYQGGSDSIFNIQPLCRKCNSSKGPETKDFRSSDCKDWAERLHNEIETPAGNKENASQMPAFQNQNHITPPNPLGGGLLDGVEETIIVKTHRGSDLTGKKAEAFLRFWDSFNYKMGRPEAATSWRKIDGYTPELAETIILAAAEAAKERTAIIENGSTPKMAQGWLSAMRWTDYEGTSEDDMADLKYQAWRNGQWKDKWGEPDPDWVR